MDARASRRLEHWKTRLINLDKRNRLLNYRPTRASSLAFVNPDLPEVWARLLRGNKLLPAARPEPAPDDGPAVPSGRAAPDLVADADGATLAKNLYRLFLLARSSLEEQGFNTLHLAFGMLAWTDPQEPGRTLEAPLLLLPAELVRRGARSDLRLVRFDDEPRVNPALLEKLDRDFDLRPELPGDDEDLDVAAVLDAFRAVAAARDGWEVRPSLHLALFSFEKAALYNDIERHGERIALHPIVQAMSDWTDEQTPDDATETRPAEPVALDEAWDPERSFQILDADASQQEAVIAALHGESFVLEGPPGTGKSQTIANLIAESLGAGRSVLFVSQKMAALEVVERRLRQAGLSDFCLEIHSRKANKREVIQQLGHTWRRAADKPPSARRLSRAELARLRARLDAYAEELHAPRGAAGFSAYHVLGRVAELAHVYDVDFPLEDPEAIDRDRLAAVEKALKRLRDAREPVEPVREHAWHGARLDHIGLDTVDGARRLANRVLLAVEQVSEAASKLGDALGVEAPETRARLAETIALAEHVETSPKPERSWVADPGWAGASPRAHEWLRKGAERARIAGSLLERYRDDFVTTYHGPLLDLAARTHGLLGWLRRRRLRKAVGGWLVPGAPPPGDAASDVRDAGRCLALATELEKDATFAAETFGGAYAGTATDFDGLARTVEWIARLRALVPRDDLPEGLVQRVARGPEDVLGPALAAAREAARRFDGECAELAEAVRLDEGAAFGAPLAESRLDEVGARARRWSDEAGTLTAWAAYARLRNAAEELGLGPYLDRFDAAGRPAAALVNAWFRRYFRALADHWLRAVDVLAAFDRNLHEAEIGEFRRLDEKLIAVSRDRLVQALLKGIPPPAGKARKDSEEGVLRREIEKQRRHLPIRTLFERSATLVRRLKPCVMTSPLSVATHLPMSGEPFDLVVFDEASQIRPEDAIGAIARGRQVVIVGDSQQLPPTNFFAMQLQEPAAAADEELEDDLESILKEARTSLPVRSLTWHYRSLDDSLIAFSNRNFYDDRLVTFPSPVRDRADLGLSLRHVPGGVYDRGGSATNAVEAQAVADEVFRLLGTRPDQSLGVVTFSEAQREAVLDAIERRRREHDEFQERFEDAIEPVFVKNLETVQGDERDVVLFSVGYGRDREGRFAHNFGPLNREGGDRRLNVAVTRARRQVIVLASILPEDIDPSRTGSRGARLLRTYLEYALHGPPPAPVVPDGTAEGRGDPELSFAAAVREALGRHGEAVDAGIGSSGARIELAVRDTERPDRYLLGLELDGPVFRKARTARDRHRIRPSVLGRLGWRLHHLWSPAWARSPEQEVRLVLEALASARAESPAPPPTGTPGGPA